MARTPQSAPRKRREKRRGGEIPELEGPAGKRSDTLQGSREGLWRVCGARGAGLCGDRQSKPLPKQHAPPPTPGGVEGEAPARGQR